MSKKILIIAGEASGDLYGAHLVRALKKRNLEAKFLGVGGAKMKEAGVEIIYPIDELAILGVAEILPKLRNIKRLFSLLRSKLDEGKIDLGILVNYPGFNLRFARILKAKNIPVIFYSSPQVWAWGRWRIKEIKRFVDKMIVFLKFEEEFYKRYSIEAEFVGHPLVDIARPSGEDLEIKKDANAKIISLVPGSRKSEIKALFPIILEAARVIHSKNKNVQFLITKHPQLPFEIYQSILKRYRLPIKLIDGKIHDCLNISDVAIIVSGSATLEAAILRLPMVIIYRVSPITGIFFLIFLRVAHIGLVNVIAKRRLMPEFVQYNATPHKIAREVMDILTHKERHKKMKEDLEKVNNLFGPPGASDRAAEAIARLLE